jgi:hypothetical protein
VDTVGGVVGFGEVELKRKKVSVASCGVRAACEPVKVSITCEQNSVTNEKAAETAGAQGACLTCAPAPRPAIPSGGTRPEPQKSLQCANIETLHRLPARTLQFGTVVSWQTWRQPRLLCVCDARHSSAISERISIALALLGLERLLIGGAVQDCVAPREVTSQLVRMHGEH